jgi:hypothetical protein
MSYLNAYDRAKRPKFRADQLSFFTPTALIPIEGRRRIEMQHATPEDLQEWDEIITREFEAASAAYARKKEYINSRLSVWNSDEFKTLGKLESARFSANSETPLAR